MSVSVISAPTTAAPCGSLIVPEIDVVDCTWANIAAGTDRATAKMRIKNSRCRLQNRLEAGVDKHPPLFFILTPLLSNVGSNRHNPHSSLLVLRIPLLCKGVVKRKYS